MRFFYDDFTSRLRGRVMLLTADLMTLGAAILFASGACYRRSIEDPLLIAVWAVIPRAVGRYLEWIQKPRRTRDGFFLAGLFVIANVVLMLAGWELLWLSATAAERPEPHTLVAIYLAWGTGYLLIFPRCYRVHDALVATVMVLGLIERMPQPLLWVPIFLLGLCLSAAARHLVHDVFENVKRPSLNLQNARVVAIGAALLLALSYGAVFAGLYPLVDRPGTPLPGSVPLIVGIFDAGLASPDDEETPARGARPDPAAESKWRRAGLSDRARLSDLQPPLGDRRVAFSARPLGVANWKPSPETLWKARSFAHFDPGSRSWTEVEAPHSRKWPPNQTLRVVAPFSGKDVELAIEVHEGERLPVLTSPYYASKYGPIVRQPRDEAFRLNSFGDIFPVPPLAGGDLYVVRFSPSDFDPSRHAAARAHGSFPDSSYLSVPEENEVGIDLAALASSIFTGEASIQSHLQALQDFLVADFQYHNAAHWVGSSARLRVFLEEEKVGDCVYFATSAALLLRCAGISTRLTSGYLGGEWNEKLGRILVRNRSAHTWVEVFVPGLGWIPIDPANWVPKHPDFDSRAPGLVAGEPPSLDPASEEPGAAGGAGESARASAPPAPGTGPDALARGDNAGAIPPGAGDPTAPNPPPFAGPSERMDQRRQERAEEERLLAGIAPGAELEERLRRFQASLPPAADGEGGSSGPASRADSALVLDRTDLRYALPDDVAGGAPRPRGFLGALLRIAILILGGVAGGLAILSYFRPGRDEDEAVDGRDLDESLPAPLLAADAEEIAFVPTDRSGDILLSYHQLQRALRRTRLHRRHSETPFEHARRIGQRYPKAGHALRLIVTTMYGILFGTHHASESEVENTRRLCRRLGKKLT